MFNTASDKLTLTRVPSRNSEIWELGENVIWTMQNGAQIIVLKGFRLDLASIPRWAKFFVSNDNYRVHRPAVIHDWMYVQRGHVGLRRPLKRAEADQIFYDALLYEGLNKFTAYMMWLAVRVGGEAYWNN